MKRNNLNDLIKKSNIIHNYSYDYSLLLKHKNMHNYVDIICKKHGIFSLSLHSHINKRRGCKQCSIDKRKDDKKTFIEKAVKKHGKKFIYDKVNYINSKTKVLIFCKKHGHFSQAPNYHLQGQGCPICNESKGENKIRKYLEENNINYIYQKSFNDLKYKRSLFFDFYLPEKNICIEFDGEQHFISVKNWGGDNGLKNRKNKDELKTNYCVKNKIELIRISYSENIIDRLNRIFK